MTGTSGANSMVGGPLPKWQLALAVAAPVALGLGYMYYKNSTQPSSKNNRGKAKGSLKKNGTPSTDKRGSLDDVSLSKVTSEVETPLQKAQRFKDEGNELFKIGKYDEAITKYNNAIGTCPKENTLDLATFYQNRAAAYEQLEKYSAVKADCTQALELNPKYAKALLRRARARENCNELELALEDVTAACIFEEFGNHTSVAMVDRVLNQLGKQQATDYLANRKPVMPSKYFIKTYIMTFHNDPIFTLLKKGKNSDVSPRLAKVLQCVHDQNYDDVIPLCTKEINSSEPDASLDKMRLLLTRATFHVLLGQQDAAIEDFGTIVDSVDAKKEIKVNALIKRAAIFMQLEGPSKSICDFELAIELDPDCGDIYYHRGQVNLFAEKVEDAADDFRKAAELNPNFALAYVQKCFTIYQFGRVRNNLEMMDNAMREFEIAFKKFPDCSHCYTLYAQILSQMKEYQKADNYFAKAIEKDPNDATIYVHRGLLQLQWKDNIELAIKYINEALQVDDKCEYAYETLGTIEVQRGNIAKAIELFDKALLLVRTAKELTHIFGLRDVAKTHLTLKNRLGVNVVHTLQNVS